MPLVHEDMGHKKGSKDSKSRRYLPDTHIIRRICWVLKHIFKIYIISRIVVIIQK